MSDSNIPPDPETSPEPPQPRKVFESSLNLERRRIKLSPGMTGSILLIIVVAAIYIAMFGMHKQRVIDTVGQIVYAANSGPAGASQLFITSGDGMGHLLPSGDGNDSSPVFAPNGNRIAFLTLRDKSVRQVYYVEADGANVVAVTRNSGTKLQPAFASSDSRLLGYISGGNLFMYDIGTGDSDQILPMVTTVGAPSQNADSQGQDAIPTTISSFAWQPATSRNNQELAAVEDNNGVQKLAISGLQGKVIDTLNGEPNAAPLIAADAMTVGWSSDGGLLAVAVRGVKNPAPGAPNSGIFLFDAQGNRLNQKGPVRIIQSTIGPENPVFSPDNTLIACEIWSQKTIATRKCAGLFLAPTNASALPQSIYDGEVGNIRFSIDGSALYFLAKNPNGNHDLCRININGSNLQKITDGKIDVTSFSLSPQLKH